MASDGHVEEERDAVVHYLRRRAESWRKLVSADYAVTVAGEMDDLADEIEAARHWVAE